MVTFLSSPGIRASSSIARHENIMGMVQCRVKPVLLLKDGGWMPHLITPCLTEARLQSRKHYQNVWHNITNLYLHCLHSLLYGIMHRKFLERNEWYPIR